MLGRGLESLIPPQKKPEDESREQLAARQTAPVPDSQEIRKDLVNLLVSEEKEASAEKPTEQSLQENILDSFSPKMAANRKESSDKQTEAIFMIELDKIKSNPHQPRRHFDEDSIKELAASIQEFGILQPILVSKLEEETENGTRVDYQLIAGERRYLAAKMLGLTQVPAIIKKINFETETLAMAVIENIQRADLNPLETARAFAKLQDKFGLTQREIAQKVGKSRESVANTIRLLNLPSNIQEALSNGQINESQARTLLAVADLSQQQSFFRELVSGNLSVKDLREKINPKENFSADKDSECTYLENQLEEILGAKVKVNKNQNKGRIIIKFFSPQELDGIIKKICG